MIKNNIVWFEEVTKSDVGLVGGKGANLGEMTNARLPVPYGFVVTSNAYFTFIKEAHLQEKIKQLLTNINYENSNELNQASVHIQNLILNADMPEKIGKEIISFYQDLTLKEEKYFSHNVSIIDQARHQLKGLYRPPLVAVRSSATAEDLPQASFAGQQETYLNIKGEAHLLKKVKECWASLFNARAIYYRYNQGFDHFKVGLAAVVQRMVQSEKSGIAFSVHPVTEDRNQMIIEGSWGLGEAIVSGQITPDSYVVEKDTNTIIDTNTAEKSKGLFGDGKGKNVWKTIPGKKANTECLSGKEVIALGEIIKQIEKHYGFPCDIEWAFEKKNFFITQSRPITTLK